MSFAFHPALVAAYPVLFLWSQNLGEVDPADVVPVLLALVGLATIATGVVAIPFRDLRRAALIVTPLVIGLLMYGHLENLVRPLHVPRWAQQAGWAALVLAGLIAAIRGSTIRVEAITRVLNGIAAVLVVVTLVSIVPFQVTSMLVRAEPLDQGADLPGTTDRPLRDVYYLILDRYGSDRALELVYGIQNDLTGWLRERGFRVLQDSHANYVKTSLSIASTLNMTHLDTLAARMGRANADHDPVFEMLQDSAVVRRFKALGYRYEHIGSFYSPTRTDRAADVNHYVGGPSDFVAGLYDVSALPAIARRLGASTRKPIEERAYAAGTFGWAALERIRDHPGPKLVFGHFLLPHPPAVFDTDGSYLTAEEASGMSSVERLGRQLAWTNTELREFIDALLALPEERRPIIILQADEGPYPPGFSSKAADYWTDATAEQLEIKFGILNAWYVPGSEDIGLYDSMTSVNTFTTLFGGYFGLPIERLPDRIYTSVNNDRPYDLADVTDRIPTARAADDAP
jgi:hypothetical protein